MIAFIKLGEFIFFFLNARFVKHMFKVYYIDGHRYIDFFYSLLIEYNNTYGFPAEFVSFDQWTV